MSLPSRDRFGEIATKGAHLALRSVGQAPEQRAARRLREQAGADSPPSRGPRVLIQTPKDWVAHVHWDAMLGQALRLRGADVRFLTCGGGLEICDRANTWEAPPMPCRTCSSYVRTSLDAHGFTQYELAEQWDDGSWPELDVLGLHELQEVVHDGLPLGELTAIPIRWFLMAADIDNDPLAPVTTRRFLRSARRIAAATVRVLDTVRPEVVVCTNGLFLFEAITVELCRARGIDYVTYERGLIKETLVFERNGIACLFGLDDAWAARKDEPLTPDAERQLDDYLAERRIGARTIDRFWRDVHFAAPERRRAGRLVSLFSNLTWDSAVIGRSGAYDSIRSWVLDVVAHMATRPQDELLIRAHPAEVKLPGKQTREPLASILEEVSPLPPNVRLIAADDPTSSYPIMAASDVGLVFSSTVGLEMAVLGRPVVVAGQTHYGHKGFTLDPADPAAHRAMLDRALDDPAAVAPDVELARRYAHLFFFGHPVAWRSVEEHVLGLARITVEELDDLAPGADPDLDRVCDLVIGR